jgi:hypothetical protein
VEKPSASREVAKRKEENDHTYLGKKFQMTLHKI